MFHLLIGNCFITSRLLIEITIRRVPKFTISVLGGDLRCVLNDPHNEKNNMDHPSRIKNNRIPDYTRTLPRPHPCHRLERPQLLGQTQRRAPEPDGSTAAGPPRAADTTSETTNVSHVYQRPNSEWRFGGEPPGEGRELAVGERGGCLDDGTLSLFGFATLRMQARRTCRFLCGIPWGVPCK